MPQRQILIHPRHLARPTATRTCAHPPLTNHRRRPVHLRHLHAKRHLARAHWVRMKCRAARGQMHLVQLLLKVPVLVVLEVAPLVLLALLLELLGLLLGGGERGDDGEYEEDEEEEHFQAGYGEGAFGLPAEAEEGGVDGVAAAPCEVPWYFGWVVCVGIIAGGLQGDGVGPDDNEGAVDDGREHWREGVCEVHDDLDEEDEGGEDGDDKGPIGCAGSVSSEVISTTAISTHN